MKKILTLVLALCLVFAFTADAFAAKFEFSKQPESATTSKNGTVSFSVTVKGEVSSYTWYFVNPSAGKKISGKKLPKSVKGVKVTGPNRATITLSNVPEKMHGWLVYCHVVSKSSHKIDSDYVTLLVYGMDPPESDSPVGPLTITKQPKDTAIDAEGTLTFSIKYTGLAEKITWAFINPKNGEKVIGKKIKNKFKDVKLKGVNSKKFVISNVPEGMVGWGVYAHLKGKGVEFNSDTVKILAAGTAEEPAATEAPAVTEAPAAEQPAAHDAPAAEQAPAAQEGVSQPVEEAEPENPDAIEYAGGELENKTVTISSVKDYLRKLDSIGNLVDGEPSSKLEFLNTGSFVIASDEMIKSWSVNGIRFETSEPVKQIKIMNVTDDMVIDLSLVRATAATAQVDESHMCRVSCTGCTFTYLSAGLRSVTEGEVPAGAPIRVSADSPQLAAGGYSVNGAEPQNPGLASFQLIVSEDVTIVAK